MIHYYHHCTKRRSAALRVGLICYPQDYFRPLGWDWRHDAIRRNPWIIEGFCNRETFGRGYARGGHLVLIRSLRDGRRKLVADWLLKIASELGLTKGAA